MSRALTANVWRPGLTFLVKGEVQAVKAAPSSEHWNVPPSFERNENDALFDFVFLSG